MRTELEYADIVEIRKINSTISTHQGTIAKCQKFIENLKQRKYEIEKGLPLYVFNPEIEDVSSIEIFDPELECECHGKKGSYYIDGEQEKIGLCRESLEQQYEICKVYQPPKRDTEEIRLNYCKKCGTSLDEHDRAFCEDNKYPALLGENDKSDAIFNIAEKFNIDLTEANQKCADNGRHGAVENDLKLDLCDALVEYQHAEFMEETKSSFVIDWLVDRGYELDEIQSVLGKIELVQEDEDLTKLQDSELENQWQKCADGIKHYLEIYYGKEADRYTKDKAFNKAQELQLRQSAIDEEKSRRAK